MEREQEWKGGPDPTLPSLPPRCTRPRDSLWQHAVSMLAFKSRFYPSGGGYPKRRLGVSYTCIYVPVAKSDSREPGTRRRLPHYGTVETGEVGDRVEEHPLFRGGARCTARRIRIVSLP